MHPQHIPTPTHTSLTHARPRTSGWVDENAWATRAATSTGTQDARQAAGREAAEQGGFLSRGADAAELEDVAGEQGREGEGLWDVPTTDPGAAALAPVAGAGAGAAEGADTRSSPSGASASTHSRRRSPALAPPKSL